MTHATPAALYAKSADRDWECDSVMPQAALDLVCTIFFILDVEKYTNNCVHLEEGISLAINIRTGLILCHVFQKLINACAKNEAQKSQNDCTLLFKKYSPSLECLLAKVLNLASINQQMLQTLFKEGEHITK